MATVKPFLVKSFSRSKFDVENKLCEVDEKSTIIGESILFKFVTKSDNNYGHFFTILIAARQAFFFI